jgi:hypothetical protein
MFGLANVDTTTTTAVTSTTTRMTRMTIERRGAVARPPRPNASRRVEDPFGLPHFKTHEVRDDPVGSWVHHAWEATEHVVDEFAEEFEEFGEDTARVFEPRGKMSSFGAEGGHHSPTTM